MNRFVISDIHGCSKTFKALIDKIQLSKNDQLYLLGDYIDRGPDSKGVLDYIIELIDAEYNIYPLRGNHEENLLNAYKEYDKESFVLMLKRITKSADLLNHKNELDINHLEFLKALPYYIELDDCFLVHGGFDPLKPNPFTDYSSMINLYVNYESYQPKILKGKRMIHGHKVTEIQNIEQQIKSRAQVIPLDNGCAYINKHKIYNIEKIGQLCCLNIDSFELIVQSNIESSNNS